MALAGAVSSAIACKRKVDPPPPTPVHVLSGSFALADLIRQAGGQYVVPVWLSESQQPYEWIAPDAKLNERVGDADLIVLGSAVEARFIDVENRMISADRVLRLPIPEKSDWPTNAALWTDPQAVRSILPDLADRLVRRRPLLDGHYRAAVATVDGSLALLLDEMQQAAERLRSLKLLLLDTRPLPMLAGLGLRWAHLPMDITRPLSGEEISQIRSAATKEDATALLLPADLPSAMRDSISQRVRMKSTAIDVLGRPGTDYFALMRDGLRALVSLTESD